MKFEGIVTITYGRSGGLEKKAKEERVGFCVLGQGERGSLVRTVRKVGG